MKVTTPVTRVKFSGHLFNVGKITGHHVTLTNKERTIQIPIPKKRGVLNPLYLLSQVSPA